MADSDQSKGLYQKYLVFRTDGSSEPGEKHAKCLYYVLDIDHDKYAPVALKAYADACETEYPQLALDLRVMAAGSPLVNEPPGEEAAQATKES